MQDWFSGRLKQVMSDLRDRGFAGPREATDGMSMSTPVPQDNLVIAADYLELVE